MNQQRNADRAERDAERTAGDGEQSALDHELTHQPGAAGAERRPQRKIVLAPRNACEQQAGHVGARDQQDQADGAHQDAEHRPHATGQLVAQRHERHRRGLVLGGELAAQLGMDRIDVGARRVERRAGLEPPDGLQMLAAAAAIGDRPVVADERPHLGALIEAFGDERLEGWRHHADDREWPIVHRDHPSDGGRIGAEPAAPEAVAQDGGLPAGGRVFGGGEVAPDRRRDAEHPEEVPRHAHPADPFRLAVGHQRRTPRADERHVVERVAAVAPVEERQVADVAGRSGRPPLADGDEAIGIRIRQRTEQHGIEDAEDRRVRADAEGERHERDRREAGRAPQQPRGVANVPPEVDQQARRTVRGRRQRRGGARPIGASDLLGHPRAIGEGRQRPLERLGLSDAGRDEIRVLLGDVLRHLVGDVTGARRSTGKRVQPRADESVPVVHCQFLWTRNEGIATKARKHENVRDDPFRVFVFSWQITCHLESPSTDRAWTRGAPGGTRPPRR
jgi:hypothetical protein